MTDRRTTLRPVRPATVTRRRTEPMETQPWPSAEDLDGWYVDMSGSPVKDEIQRAPSGPAAARAVHQPARLGGDRRSRRSGALSPGDTMLDVACGRGAAAWRSSPAPGPGWCGWTSRPRRCGRPASTHDGWAAPGGFRLGNLAARPGRRLGRRRAMRGRDPVLPAARRRLLRATAGPWARRTCGADLLGALGQGDERPPGRLRRVDVAARLTAVGFSNMEVRDRLCWRACERAMWQDAAALDPGDDPALQSFHDERHALPRNPRPDTPGHRHRRRTVDAHSMR